WTRPRHADASSLLVSLLSAGTRSRAVFQSPTANAVAAFWDTAAAWATSGGRSAGAIRPPTGRGAGFVVGGAVVGAAVVGAVVAARACVAAGAAVPAAAAVAVGAPKSSRQTGSARRSGAVAAACVCDPCQRGTSHFFAPAPAAPRTMLEAEPDAGARSDAE